MLFACPRDLVPVAVAVVVVVVVVVVASVVCARLRWLRCRCSPWWRCFFCFFVFVFVCFVVVFVSDTSAAAVVV